MHLLTTAPLQHLLIIMIVNHIIILDYKFKIYKKFIIKYILYYINNYRIYKRVMPCVARHNARSHVPGLFKGRM